MSVNAFTEEYEYIELFGKPGLFTNARIDRDTVPEGWYAYDLRGSDYDPGEPVTVEPSVVVNHAGTILTHEPISFPKEGFKRLNGQLDFADAYHLSLREFCDERGLNYPEDNRKFTLRPASPDEAGLFYSQEEQDTELATVGHMRFDHGSGGNEFWTTWWEHNGNALNTHDFKVELQEFVDEMRRIGPLRNGDVMFDYCYSNGDKLDGGTHSSFGFIAESENYRYCLRCTPRQGDYSYIYIYDKRQQELNMAQEPLVIGTVSFAIGETLAYTDPDIFLQVIRDELPYKPTSGFQYQVLTDDPAVRKGADDILYDLFGEENPRPLSDYGLTPKGRQALKNAENPNLPHSYRWFVVENFGCDGEMRHDTDSLTGAIDHFNGLICEET